MTESEELRGQTWRRSGQNLNPVPAQMAESGVTQTNDLFVFV